MKPAITGIILLLLLSWNVRNAQAEALVPSNDASQSTVDTALDETQGSATDSPQPEPDAVETTSEGLSAAEDASDEKVIERVKITSGGRSGLVCRYERPLGTHIPRQVCRTQAEMDAARENAKDTVREGAILRDRRSLGRVRRGNYNMSDYKAGKY